MSLAEIARVYAIAAVVLLAAAVVLVVVAPSKGIIYGVLLVPALVLAVWFLGGWTQLRLILPHLGGMVFMLAWGSLLAAFVVEIAGSRIEG